MGWARVNGATLGARATLTDGVTSNNFGDLGAAVAVNNKILAVISLADQNLNTVTSVTDSLGNTWSKDLSNVRLGYDIEVSIWSTLSAAGTPLNLTANFSGTVLSARIVACFGAYSGLAPLTGMTGIDISKISPGSGNGPADSGVTTGTTSAANELKVGFYADLANTAKTLGAGTVDTNYSVFIKRDQTVQDDALIEDADSGQMGTTAQAQVNITDAPPGPSNGYSMAVVVYKVAPPPGLRGLPVVRRGRAF